MKTTDFLNENFIADATEAHQDHEVQMARSDCYNAAKYAIELHKLLKHISEQQGLDGWVSEKITLANDYLRTVTEYLRYEQQSSSSGMPEFDAGSATQTLDAALGESQRPAVVNTNKQKVVVKTNKPIGSRVADIGPGGKEYNVKTDKAWDDQHQEKKDVEEGSTWYAGNGAIKEKIAKYEELALAANRAGDDAKTKMYQQKIQTLKQKMSHMEEGKADPVGSWVVYDGGKVKRFKSHEGAKAYAEKNGGKVASSEHYADKIQGNIEEGQGESDPLANRAEYAKQHGTGQVYKKTNPSDKVGMSKSYAYDIKRAGPKGVLPEQDVTEAASGIDPQLVSILKQRGFKGPYQVGKLKKWYAELKQIGAIATDEIMVTGNDVDYDHWVIEAGPGHYYFGAEIGYTSGNAQKVIKGTADLGLDEVSETTSAGIATAPSKVTKNAGTLFGGSYKQKK